MEEVFNAARLLHDTPDIFPWVVLAVVLLILYKERALIRDFFLSAIQARVDSANYQAQNNEIIRNNTAALENNTAVLEMIKKDRDLMLKELELHEQMSAERMSHIQTVINRVDETVRDNRQDIVLVKDRDDRK